MTTFMRRVHDPRLMLLPADLEKRARLRRNAKQLLIVMGLQGSGKSTCGNHLARRLCGTHFDSDAIRHELFGDTPSIDTYSEEAKHRIDNLMYAKGIEEATRGTAIVNATFASRRRRQELLDAVDLARRRGASFRTMWLFVHADDDVACRRIENRLQQRDNKSTATWDYRQASAKRYEALDIEYVYIDNSFHGLHAIARLEAILDSLIDMGATSMEDV